MPSATGADSEEKPQKQLAQRKLYTLMDYLTGQLKNRADSVKLLIVKLKILFKQFNNNKLYPFCLIIFIRVSNITIKIKTSRQN